MPMCSRQLPLIGLLFVAWSIPASASLATEYPIVIEHMKFGALPATAHVGDVIVWQNRDIFRHTATARDKSFDVELPPGADTPMPLKQSGSFAFFCRFHPGMTGTLVVSP
jgi:plastocyanin